MDDHRLRAGFQVIIYEARFFNNNYNNNHSLANFFFIFTVHNFLFTADDQP